MSAGTAHRAWLEPLRRRYLASGLTLDWLVERSGYSKTRISELLRGAGYYPRWEITYSVAQVLGIPVWPMRRLWTAAAHEARKKQDWIDGCIAKVALSIRPDVPPMDYQAFSDANRAAYTEYAKVFLLSDQRANWVVAETLDILWLRWDEALTSSNVQKFAWKVLRSRVMARTPHSEGRPDLRQAAFGTVALRRAETSGDGFAQVEESLVLFQAIGRLPENQLDVVVLRHLCGMDEAAAADVLGVPLATVRSDERHAKRALSEALSPHRRPEGIPQ